MSPSIHMGTGGGPMDPCGSIGPPNKVIVKLTEDVVLLGIDQKATVADLLAAQRHIEVAAEALARRAQQIGATVSIPTMPPEPVS